MPCATCFYICKRSNVFYIVGSPFKWIFALLLNKMDNLLFLFIKFIGLIKRIETIKTILIDIHDENAVNPGSCNVKLSRSFRIFGYRNLAPDI